jgi:hypothetical protein
MKTKLLLALLIVSIAPTLYATPVYTDTFQGVTFTFTKTDADTLTFRIQGTPSGDWAGVLYLGAFAIKEIGIDFTTATGTANGPGATNLISLNSQLSAANIDCLATTGQAGIGCWDVDPDIALGSLPFDFTYIIDFSSPLNISSEGPHLQIVFTKTEGGKKVGSLYSRNVGSSGTGTSGSQVPEPATGSLVLIGLALIGTGFGFRRRSHR